MNDTPARLIVRQGPYPNQEYLLTQATTTIGRGPNNDIVFADPEVSRQHAQIILQADGEYTMKDLGSTNGSFLNGHRITGVMSLQDGDTINLGESIVLTFLQSEQDTWPIHDALDAAPTLELPTEKWQPVEADEQLEVAVAPDPFAASPQRGRRFLVGCVTALFVSVCLCVALFFFLDAYDQGRLLYCGFLRPFFEIVLGPFGFAPLCG